MTDEHLRRETSMHTDRHWLQSFESVRGLAYTVAIVSLFAPSLIAVFLLSPEMLRVLPWPTLLALCSAVGGVASVLSIADIAVGTRYGSFLFMRTDRERADAVARALLSLAPLLALLPQAIGLLVTLHRGDTFRTYVGLTLGVAVVFLLVDLAVTALKISFRKYRDARLRKKPSA